MILLLSGLLVLNLACSSDDDDNGGTNVVVPTYDDPVLETMATQGAVVVQGLIDMAPGWIQGNPGQKDTTEPVWDSDCSCWRWTIAEGDEQSQPVWFRNWNFALTFFSGETPQMTIEGSDRIQVVLNYNYDTSSYVDDQNNSYSTFYFDLTLTNEMLNEQTMEVSGSGAGNLNAYSMNDGVPFQVYQNITVSLYLTLPVVGGCPSGSFEIDTNTTSFSVGFVGESTAYWDYVYGPGQSKEGTLKFSCGK